jgi:hypothetical protein
MELILAKSPLAVLGQQRRVICLTGAVEHRDQPRVLAITLEIE